MKYRIKIAPLCFVLIMSVPSLAQAADSHQPPVTTTKIQGKIPSTRATIVKYSVAATDLNADAPTGDLSIEFSDGTTVVEKLPPARKSTEKETVFNEVGFNGIKLSGDRRVIGWTELFENCCASYPVPEALAIYRSGGMVVHIQQGQMLWDWTFLDGSEHVAVVWGPTHGTSTGNYQLYDARTGRMLSEFVKDTEDKFRRSDTPKWVQDADQEMFSRKLNGKQ